MILLLILGVSSFRLTVYNVILYDVFLHYLAAEACSL